MAALDRYRERLNNPTPPGAGFHSWLMGTANLGVLAKLQPERIETDLRQANPLRARQRPGEITEAIRKAMAECGAGGSYRPAPKPEPAIRDGTAARDKIIAQGKIGHEADLWEVSPVRPLDDPKTDMILLLETLYRPPDLVYTGDRVEPGVIGRTIRTTCQWIDHFRKVGKTGPHIIPNPLDGIPRPKKTGEGETLRGDANISEFRFCVVEFDILSREDQIKFWCAVKLPICCLIDSGGKSIHAWLEVAKLAQVGTLAEWQTNIKSRLYQSILEPLGVDPQCSNPARLSRLPGHFRNEKGAMQKLLWLSPEGKPLC